MVKKVKDLRDAKIDLVFDGLGVLRELVGREVFYTALSYFVHGHPDLDVIKDPSPKVVAMQQVFEKMAKGSNKKSKEA